MNADLLTKVIICVVLVLIFAFGLHSYLTSRTMPAAFKRALVPFYIMCSLFFVVMAGFLTYLSMH